MRHRATLRIKPRASSIEAVQAFEIAALIAMSVTTRAGSVLLPHKLAPGLPNI
jgi:hypothetical protein